MKRTIAMISAAIVCLLGAPTIAQQVRVDTPFNTITDNYFERTGIDFGFTLPATPNARITGDRRRGVVGLLPDGTLDPNGITFSQGSAASAIPPFGGYDPNSEGHIGFQKFKDGGSVSFNFFGGKGSSRTLTNQTPSVVIPNGGTGVVADQVVRPFVTSIVPVVGVGRCGISSPVRFGSPVRTYSPIDIALQRLSEQGRTLESLKLEIAEQDQQPRPAAVRVASNEPSSATQGALSVAEIRRQRSAQKSENQEEVDALLEKVDLAESEGRFGTARVYLSQAVRKTSGNQRQQLEARYRDLKKKR